MAKNVAWDKVGACASGICAVHCALTGVALGLMSSLGFGFFGSLWIDGLFFGIAILVGAVALWHGMRKHGSYVPALFYIGGLAAIVIAHLGDFSHGAPVHSEHRHSPLTATLSVLGGLCFVTFHVLNLRLRHAAAHDCRSHSAGESGAVRRQPGL